MPPDSQSEALRERRVVDAQTSVRDFGDDLSTRREPLSEDAAIIVGSGDRQVL